MSKKKLHVGNTARDLLAELGKSREFNGLDILNIEPEMIWHREYAIFLVEFDTYVEYDNPYMSFDLDQFFIDFENHLVNRFPGCSIRNSCRHAEYEILGPNYNEFYEKYKDRIEKFHLDNEDIFKRGEIVIWEPRKSSGLTNRKPRMKK